MKLPTFRSRSVVRNTIVRAAPGAFFFVLVSVVGCGGGSETNGPDSCWPEMTPEEANIDVDLGVGEPFEPFASNQAVDIIMGLQGGYHIEVNVRATNLRPGGPDDGNRGNNPRVLFSALREDGEEVDFLSCPYTTELTEFDAGYGFGDVQLLILDSSVAPELEGSRLRLTVEVLDKKGNYGKDERWVLVDEIKSAR